jgi:hypothetical protein
MSTKDLEVKLTVKSSEKKAKQQERRTPSRPHRKFVA